MHEKEGGVEFNRRAGQKFGDCIFNCGLVDLGYNGPLFTWKSGAPRRRLDMALGNARWQEAFPFSSVVNLPLPSLDRWGIWLKLGNSPPPTDGNYFKFLRRWLDQEDFHTQVQNYYQNLFASARSVRQPLRTAASFPPISHEDLAGIGADVTTEEVRRALFSMGNYKAPGPHGFHLLFFKEKWDTVGGSIVDFVQHVFAHLTSIGDVNQTLLILIPKGIDPSRAFDFRPIALCNVIYKIVTKILASRIKYIIPNIISKCQSSLIMGRNTTDNTIVLQEAVQSMIFMSGKQRYLVIKLDLAKALRQNGLAFYPGCPADSSLSSAYH